MDEARRRVAVVGLGIGQAHVYGYTRRRDLFDIAVLCDPDPERTGPLAERLAKHHPDVRVVTDLAEVCADPDVDIVSICTPPFLHHEQVGAVIDAGKHVVCEKPLVGSLREVDDLAARSAANGVVVMPVFQYRYGHGLQKLKALVDAGLAGELHTASVEVAWRRREDYYAVPWRGKWATELGGLLLSHCVHALDMTTYVAGEPAKVFARTSTRVNDIETEDCASVSIELESGGYVTLSATLGSAAEISRHRFVFAGLVAESNTEPYTSSSDPWTFVGDTPELQDKIDSVLQSWGGEGGAPAESYQRQFELLDDALRSGTTPPVTLVDARRSIELVTAMYASARDGVDVRLPLPYDHPDVGGWQR